MHKMIAAALLAGTPVGSNADELKLQFAGFYDSRSEYPYDVDHMQIIHAPVSGWITYNQSALPFSYSPSYAQYTTAVTGFSFSSTEYGQFTSTSYPNAFSRIQVQAGSESAMVRFDITGPGSGWQLGIALSYPNGSFTSTALPGQGLTPIGATNMRVSYGDGCSQYSPCGVYGDGMLSTFSITATQPVPTARELAGMSNEVYGNPSDSNRFKCIAGCSDEPGSAFKAAAFQDGNQVVVAIRGTNVGAITGFKDAAADDSFVLNVASSSMRLYTEQASQFLKEVHDAHPDAQITLTGHSLGGAIAEILASASGYSAITFNAPGPAYIEAQLGGELRPIYGLSGQLNASITSYRLWGDSVSEAGVHVDQDAHVITIAPQDRKEDDGQSRSGAVEFHKIQTVINELDAPHDLLLGEQGPVYPLDYVKAVVISGVYGFITGVEPLIDIAFDPPSAGGYIFTQTGSKILLDSILLPHYSDIDHYALNYGASGVWTRTEYVSPLSWLLFDGDDTDFELFALDKVGNLVNFNDSLLFDIKFRQGGNLVASLTLLPSQASAIPEVSTWLSILVGFALAGWRLRRSELITVVSIRHV